MLKKHEFYSLSAACRARGLSCAANTNGTFVDDEDIDRLLREGPKYLVFSIDSHEAAVHDDLRGVPGTFARAMAAITKLLARRAETGSGSDVRVMLSTILFAANLTAVDRLVDFGLALGVDGMIFQPLSRTFSNRSRKDPFFDAQAPRDVSAVNTAIDHLLQRQRAGAPIWTSANDLDWMRLYAHDPDFIGEQVCGSGERNVMIDMWGNVQLCFQMHSLSGGRSLGNTRQASLRDLWESEFAGSMRDVMSACRKNCGMLNCHRKTEAP